MKATELMIDDWVVYNGDVDYINPIKIDGMDIATGMCVTTDRDDVGFDGVWPIPLTSEILEKNGFELYKQDFTSNKIYVIDKGFTYIEDCGNYFVIGTNVEYEHFGRKLRFISSTIKVYCVHELQHALRLCGIEKEIIV